MNTFLKCLTTLLILFMLSACGTIRTYDFQNDPNLGGGLNYYLPKQRVKFSLERKVAKPADIKQQLDAVNTALSTLKSSKSTLDRDIAILNTTLQQPGVSGSPQEATYNASLGLKETELKLVVDEIAAKTAEKAQLENTFADAESGLPSYDVKVELTEMEPDLAFGFTALPKNFPTRDEENILSINQNGLLDSAKSSVTDQSGQILIEAAKAIGYNLGSPLVQDTFQPFVKSGPRGISISLPPDRFTEAGCTLNKNKPVKLEVVLDITVEEEIDALNEQLLCLMTPYALNVITPAEMTGPRTFSSIASTQTQTITPPTSSINFSENKPNGKMLFSTKKEYYNGLFYRTRLPYMLTINQINDGATLTITVSCPESNNGQNCIERFIPKAEDNDSPYSITAASSLLMLPNEAPVAFIPMKAGILVKTVHDVDFTDGIVTSWDSNRPSEALAVIKVPFSMIDAVISSISKLIPLAGDYSTAQNTVITQQLEYQNSLLELQTLQKGLTEKDSLDESTALLEAQRKQLEAQYLIEQRQAGNFVDIEPRPPASP